MKNGKEDKMKTKGKWIAVAFVLSILIIMSTSASFAQRKTAELKIGYTGPLSGSGMSWGYASYAGLDLAIEDTNKAGGLKVGNTVYTLKMVPYDTKYLPDEAITAAKRLIFEDKVKIIFGELGSATTLAMQTVTEPNKIIHFPDSYTPRTLSPDKPYTFRWFVTHTEFIPRQLEYYRERWPNAKSIAYFYVDDESGRPMNEVMLKHGPTHGFKVTGFPWERGTVDVTPFITKAIAADLDMLDLGGIPPETASQMVNTIRMMNWKKPLVRAGGAVVYDLLRLCGKDANGIVYHEDADFSTPKAAALVERFKNKKYPASPNTNMIPAYDGAMVLFKGIQRAGKVDDTKAIKEALESIKSHEGVSGTVRWGGKETYGINHQLMTPVYIGEVIDEKPTIIKKITF